MEQMLFDIAVNITSANFKTISLSELKKESIEHNVQKIFVPGSSVKSSIDALKLAKQYPNFIYCGAGVHPNYATQTDQQQLKQQLINLKDNPQIKAWGEIGLDFFRDATPKRIQEDVFIQQLEVAIQITKPVYCHERNAFDNFYSIINSFSLSKVVIHCFTGNKKQLKSYLDSNFFIGITGWICDERRGQELKDLVKYIPLDKLMLETDSPYLIPRHLKLKHNINRPKYLSDINLYIANILQIDANKLAKITWNNSLRFFDIKDDKL